jgi:hypothetical protein
VNFARLPELLAKGDKQSSERSTRLRVLVGCAKVSVRHIRSNRASLPYSLRVATANRASGLAKYVFCDVEY